MDCLEAQEIISAALDGELIDASALQQARDHCLECPACEAFQRTQLAVQEAPLPEPADDLAERAIAAAYAAAAQDASAGERPATGRGRRRRWLDRRATGWLAAAAAVLVVVAVVGSSGLFGGFQSSSERTANSTSLESQKFSTDSGAADSSAGAPSESATADQNAAEAAGSAQKADAPDIITLGGVVYASAGTMAINPASLRESGSVMTSLAEKSAAERRVVYADGDVSRIYLAADSGSGQFLAFERVTRTYAGVTYALTSAEVTAFGIWPSLPADIPAPENADGSPAFTVAGKDDSGVVIYRLSSADVSAGIAIAPGTAPDDLAGGNPNWTWWEPVR